MRAAASAYPIATGRNSGCKVRKYPGDGALADFRIDGAEGCALVRRQRAVSSGAARLAKSRGATYCRISFSFSFSTRSRPSSG